VTRIFHSWITLAAAIVFLDASLSFENIWPTPGILWTGQLSAELAALLLALVIWQRRSETPVSIGWLAAIWLVLVVGRYADVTAPALYGRDVNLYWDLQFLPDVAAMVTNAAPFWLLAMGTSAAVVVMAVAYLAVAVAIRRVRKGMAIPAERRVLLTVAFALVAGFAAEELTDFLAPRNWYERQRWFSTPVTQAYARQARVAAQAIFIPTRLAPSPSMNADLTRVKNTDVLVIFIESYGAISWERPAFAKALESSRTRLEGDIGDTGRAVVSAYVESPTFGGNSWLAHISFLSGVEVRDPHTNALLMQDKRETLATVFARAGYRTIALMPGLRRPWPEGRFYGFNETYTAEHLNYPGPDFGWFAVPDQMSLAWLDERELTRSPRPPAFVFFPTLSTHFPFSPRPPYQPDWARLLTDHKFDDADIVRAYEEELDWVDFGPAYASAVGYTYQTIGGYLRLHPNRDFVMILIGDHQPPAAVSGEGAAWDVPVHVISKDRTVLDALTARGFRRGLSPSRPALSRTHELLPILLGAFGEYR
jgi:hypothetical protein